MTNSRLLLYGALGCGAQIESLAKFVSGAVSIPDLYGHGTLANDETPNAKHCSYDA